MLPLLAPGCLGTMSVPGWRDVFEKFSSAISISRCPWSMSELSDVEENYVTAGEQHTGTYLGAF